MDISNTTHLYPGMGITIYLFWRLVIVKTFHLNHHQRLKIYLKFDSPSSFGTQSVRGGAQIPGAIQSL